MNLYKILPLFFVQIKRGQPLQQIL